MTAETTPNAAQIAAIEWIRSVVDHSVNPWPAHEHGKALLSMIPDHFTNPKSVLPTEPGWYEDAENSLWELRRSGEWFYRGHGAADDPAYVTRVAPLRRLIPERPEITPQALERVVLAADGGRMSATVRRAILAYINEGRS